MAVRLPDFTQVAGVPTGMENVPPGDIRPSYPGFDPEAEALARSGAALGALGTGLERFGTAAASAAGQERYHTNLVNASLAQADLHTNLARTEAAIKAESDPEKINQLYSQAQSHLDSASQLISDPNYRAAWVAKHTSDVVKAQLGAEAQQRKVYDDNFIAGVEQKGRELQQIGAQSPDPTAREQAKNDLGILYQSLAEAGVIPRHKAVEEGIKANQQIALGRVQYLDEQNQPQAALAQLKAGIDTGAITPAAGHGLALHLQSRADRMDIRADIDREWGGADKGYAGNLRAGGGGDPNLTGDAFLASQRARFKEELDQNPELKKRLAAIVDLENPEAGTAVAESLMNRMAMTGGSIASGIGGGDQSFYGPVRRGEHVGRQQALENDPQRLAARMQQIDQALAGSNLVQGHTDQGSAGDPNYIAGGTGINIAGERFNDFGGHAGGVEGSRQFRLQQQRQVAAGPATTATDAAPSGNAVNLGTVDVTAAPTILTGATGPAALTPASGMAPLPDIDAMQQRVQDRADRGEISQDRANAVMAGLKSRFNHLQGSQAADRAALTRNLANTAAALADGRSIDFDPAVIRHFFPAEQAVEITQKLQDAKEGGQLISNMRTSSPADILQQRAKLVAGLNEPGAPDYAKRSQLLTAYDRALEDHKKQLFAGPNADPIAYLADRNPLVQEAAQKVDPQNPQSYVDYATAALSEQTRLGVPPEQQRILSTNAAQRISMAIGADPEHAPDVMRTLSTQYGQAWPHVWSDLTTIGKLSAGYQVVGQLADYDQANAAVLARSLGARTKDGPAFEKLISSKPPGGKSIKDVADQTIPVDDKMVAYERSLGDSGSSPQQIVAIRGAVEHLAAGRAIFLHEDPSEATDKAIEAVVGRYRFMPNGGARVPSDRFGDVSANARGALDSLSLDNVAVPQRYGAAATEPKPQEYIDMIKAAPTWITGPKADRLLLLDPAGRLVTNDMGEPVNVPFSLAGPTPPPGPTGDYTLPQVPY